MRLKPDDIVCYEVGSDEPPWLGLRATLDLDWDALEDYARKGIIAINLSGGTISVSGTDRVGLIILPSGRRVIIRSKIGNLVLLDWLAYLGEFPPLDAWLTDAGLTTGDDFPVCIARLFLYELERITRLHFHKDYTPQILNASTIRGRILASRLSRRFKHLPRIPQQARLRTHDTTCNIVLALALDKLPVLLSAAVPDDRALLGQIRESWARVQRGIADPLGAVTEAQWTPPPGYRSGLQLARLILRGADLDPAVNLGGQAFTISLAQIWERSLRRMVFELCQETGWAGVPDAQRTRQWDDSAGRDDPGRWFTADVLATRNDTRWVLDAKYKRAFGNESRADRFQMCAYAVGFDATRVSLVYPTAEARAQQRTLLSTTVGSRFLLVDSIDLPMRAGPAECRRCLVDACMILTPRPPEFRTNRKP